VFDATKPKFTDIDFQRLNVDEEQTKSIEAKYGVSGIPTAVFLDGSGKVLYNGGCPADNNSWENLIKQYH